jgi:hypothetical protein
MVASTWITPGCVQFLKNKKRFHTAWVKNGLESPSERHPLILQQRTYWTVPKMEMRKFPPIKREFRPADLCDESD